MNKKKFNGRSRKINGQQKIQNSLRIMQLDIYPGGLLVTRDGGVCQESGKGSALVDNRGEAQKLSLDLLQSTSLPEK